MNNYWNGRGRLTEGDKERIRELADEGLRACVIAKRIGRHPGTVNYFMYSDGLLAPAQRGDAYTVLRNGKPVRRYTAEEDACIERLRATGLTVTEVARAISERFGYQRRAHSVGLRLRMLAAINDGKDLEEPSAPAPARRTLPIHTLS